MPLVQEYDDSEWEEPEVDFEDGLDKSFATFEDIDCAAVFEPSLAAFGYLDFTGGLLCSDPDVDEPLVCVLHTPFLHTLCTQIPLVQEEDDLEW